MLFIVIYSAITALYSVQYESTYVKFNLYEILQRAIFNSYDLTMRALRLPSRY